MGLKNSVIELNLADECREYIKIFGANKNLFRIMPSDIDGLKPVQRRFLYSLYTGKGKKTFIKMAKASSDTVADYHPHGETSVKDTAVRMASTIANNACTVTGQGNFGSFKSARAGESRYIEVKLSDYALKCFFEDFEISNVDFRPTYTGDGMEPEFLPARYPHALFNPQLSGIGVGFASNIPPFNVTEVLKATIKLMHDPDAKILLVPDSPTGADIIDDGQFPTINETGIGSFTEQSEILVDNIANTLTITSIPLQTTIDDIIRKIIILQEKKVISGIKDIKDYTKNETGVRAILYLDDTTNPEELKETLYKKNVGLREAHPVGIKMISNFADIDYGVKSFLLEWIEYRRDTVRSQYNTKLLDLLEDQNINNILLLILDKDNSEKTMKLAKKSSNKAEFAKNLMKEYEMDSQQAATISDMKMHQFNKDAYEKYKEKKKELKEEIKKLDNLLEDDSSIDKIIVEQLEEGIKLFGHKRKSRIIESDKKKVIPDSQHIISISKDGFIKKLDVSEESVGQVGSTNKNYITLWEADNRSDLIIFDSNGFASKVKISDIPEVEQLTSGVDLRKYCKKFSGEVVSAISLSHTNFSDNRSIIVLSKNGYAKRVALNDIHSMQKGTAKVSTIEDGDQIVAVELVPDSSNHEVVIYTNLGNGIRIDLNNIAIMSRTARGTRQLDVTKNEVCCGVDIIRDGTEYLLYLTNSGRMKRTQDKYFPTMKRRAAALSLISLNNKETLLAIKAVPKKGFIDIYKKNGEKVTLKLSEIPVRTRQASGEKLIKTPKGDTVLGYKIYI